MKEIFQTLNLNTHFELLGAETLPSKFNVTDLAAWSLGAVGCSIAALIERMNLSATVPKVVVDRRLASLWFNTSLYPIGWELPPLWDAVAGDYQAKDGWIKIHTNLPHHRAAALSVLDVTADREAVAKAIASWDKDTLETAIVNAGGVSAAMRTRSQWITHQQGRAVALDPLIKWSEPSSIELRDWSPTLEQPLSGLRVLDLTRVLAGPVATRTLAGFGADVLRIDPLEWDEANIVPDITLGKRCARLDLKAKNDRDIFEKLLSEADVLVHGYRSGALDQLGYSEAQRQKISPALIEVCLNAYGWAGPWKQRRGFDSLVQMSSGIAEEGQRWANTEKPTPLPVQALDHATGYLMAASVIRAIDDVLAGKGRRNAKLSLARTAELLFANQSEQPNSSSIEAARSDFSQKIEAAAWGQAHRLKPAITVAGTPMKWDRAACELGSSKPRWIEY